MVASDGRRGARAAGRRGGRLRDPRPRDAGHGRLRGAARARAARHRGAGHRLHRHRRLRPLHPGDAARRVRLHRQGRADRADRAGGRAGASSGAGSAPKCPALRRRLDGESVARGRQRRDAAKLREQIARVAPVPSTVLILGESGIGQGAGRARPAPARRRSPPAPFVAINCAALPEHLVESELFGHERGAFTGASVTRQGRVRGGGRRHAVPRRDRRAAARRAGQAAPRARGARGHPARGARKPLPVDGARRRRDEPRPRRGGGGRTVPPGPLSTGSTSTSMRGAAAARAADRRAGARRAVPGGHLRALRHAPQAPRPATRSSCSWAYDWRAQQRARAAERGGADDHRRPTAR